jgi:hypothetical protein
MKNIYAEESLIAFYYDECDILEKFEIEDALENNIHLNKKYYSLSEELTNLRSLTMKPKTRTLDKVLSYSRQ